MPNGWKYIAKVDRKGNYITLNEATGQIVVNKKVTNMPTKPSRTSVAEVRKMLFRGSKLDAWFLKHYRAWESEFAKNNIDEYNRLINLDA